VTIIDYSTSRPSISQLKAAKVDAVGRYIGWDSVSGFPSIGKNITKTEAHNLIAANIAIFLAFEYAANAAAKGAAQGAADGKLAQKQLADIGAPPNMCVYFAVDFDIPDYAPHLPDTPANALEKLGPVGHYFQAINALKLPYIIGVYGGYYAVKRVLDANLAKMAWQAIAWSGGKIEPDPRCVLFQNLDRPPIGGADVDIRLHAITSKDFGQWPRPAAPKPPKPPVPPIPATSTVQEYPVILDNLMFEQAVAVPVPSGKTKVVLYADPTMSAGHVAPVIRVGSQPTWATADLKPTWATPATWTFPHDAKYLTVGRKDTDNVPVTLDFQ